MFQMTSMQYKQGLQSEESLTTEEDHLVLTSCPLSISLEGLLTMLQVTVLVIWRTLDHATTFLPPITSCPNSDLTSLESS